MRIKIPKGSRAVDIDKASLSPHAEQEVLVARNSALVYQGASKEGRYTMHDFVLRKSPQQLKLDL